MTREDVKADARAQLRAMIDATNAENEAGVHATIASGDLDVEQGANLVEMMRAANFAELRRTEAFSDRLIDQLPARKDGA